MKVARQLYKVGTSIGYGYKIFVDYKLIIAQPFLPCLPGRSPMSYFIADQLSNIIKGKLEKGLDFGLKSENILLIMVKFMIIFYR